MSEPDEPWDIRKATFPDAPPYRDEPPAAATPQPGSPTQPPPTQPYASPPQPTAPYPPQPGSPTQPPPTQPYASPPQPTAPYPPQPDASPPQPTAPYPAPAGAYPYPGFPVPHRPAYPENSYATLALILGVLSFVVCPVTLVGGPVAWILGAREVKAIDAGRRDPGNRGQAVAGMVMGIIATVLVAVFAVVIMLAVFTEGTTPQ